MNKAVYVDYHRIANCSNDLYLSVRAGGSYEIAASYS